MMQEISGNLWDHHGRAVVVVTTCGRVDRRGEAIMLRGCARQARERFPGLALGLGERLRAGGNHVYDLGDGIVNFPVEEDPFSQPDLAIIERSCRELVALADASGWRRVVVPRPGCGGGGLDWRQVRPILARHFDGRFEVITEEPERSRPTMPASGRALRHR